MWYIKWWNLSNWSERLKWALQNTQKSTHSTSIPRAKWQNDKMTFQLEKNERRTIHFFIACRPTEGECVGKFVAIFFF